MSDDEMKDHDRQEALSLRQEDTRGSYGEERSGPHAVRRRVEGVARRETAAPPAQQPFTLGQFPALVQMGDHLYRTGFLPQHIKSGAQAAAIILTGRELGMQPMRALRSLQMIKGKVVESADSLLSRFKVEGGRARFVTMDDKGAVLHLRHPNGDEHTESFSMDDAQRAGLLSNDTWRKFPRAMLRSRCITAGLKSLGWEGGVGVYGPGELDDEPDEPPPRAMQREASGPMPRAPSQDTVQKQLAAPGPPPRRLAPMDERWSFLRCFAAASDFGLFVADVIEDLDDQRAEDDRAAIDAIEARWKDALSLRTRDEPLLALAMSSYIAQTRCQMEGSTYEWPQDENEKSREVDALRRLNNLRRADARSKGLDAAG